MPTAGSFRWPEPVIIDCKKACLYPPRASRVNDQITKLHARMRGDLLDLPLLLYMSPMGPYMAPLLGALLPAVSLPSGPSSRSCRVLVRVNQI